jgi:DNA modification methylase
MGKNDYKGMRITCETKDTLPLSALTEFQGGLKKRTAEDTKKIEKSINDYGFATPLFVWKHDGINSVLDGHGRLSALKEMQQRGEEIPALPVVYIDCPNEAAAKNLLLRICSTYGEMTVESVEAFLGELKIDFSEIKLPDGVLDLGKLEPEETKDDDEAPALKPDEVADSQRGQLYRLGRHFLYCGDSTRAEDMTALMQGTRADLIVTDPPYNVDYKGGNGLKIQNDAMDGVAFREFLTKAFINMFTSLKAGGAFYCWYVDSESVNFNEALKAAGAKVFQNLIWVKNCMVLGHLDYQKRHEPCLYGWKNGANHYWDGRRDLTTVYDEKPNYKKMSKEELLQEITKLRGDNIPNTIIYEDKPARNEEHPTMKPVKLFQRFIKNSSKEDDAILDPFGGSGTTIIACEKLNRTAYVMELDPHYCDVIRRRWTKWAEENGVDAGAARLTKRINAKQ